MAEFLTFYCISPVTIINFFHMCHLVRTTLHENTCSYKIKLYLIVIHLLTSYIILSTYCFMHMQYTHVDSVNITERAGAEANLWI